MLWCGELSGKGSTLISFPQKFHFFLRPFLVTHIATSPLTKRNQSRLPFEAVYFLSISQLKTFSFFQFFTLKIKGHNSWILDPPCYVKGILNS